MPKSRYTAFGEPVHQNGGGPGIEYFPARRATAREKFEPLFQADPGLQELADGCAKYIASPS